MYPRALFTHHQCALKGTEGLFGLQGDYIITNIKESKVLIGGDSILKIDGIVMEDNNTLFKI
ncbi:hypothetical protein [Lacinutrix jangbogonensis]|uniref:hypothetical protein n=1 Tax=Lacinutrix jangbogonensis TaxID=1469557 RepID=UPI00053E75FC|nr:hypothetical protein [Lacinutrix jangbogonensis]